MFYLFFLLFLIVSYPFVAPCLHSLEPHGMSLTIISFSRQSINHKSTQYSHSLLPNRYEWASRRSRDQVEVLEYLINIGR
jgi:hypothetical protein